MISLKDFLCAEAEKAEQQASLTPYEQLVANIDLAIEWDDRLLASANTEATADRDLANSARSLLPEAARVIAGLIKDRKYQRKAYRKVVQRLRKELQQQEAPTDGAE